jgi:hypothetical protein
MQKISVAMQTALEIIVRFMIGNRTSPTCPSLKVSGKIKVGTSIALESHGLFVCERYSWKLTSKGYRYLPEELKKGIDLAEYNWRALTESRNAGLTTWLEMALMDVKQNLHDTIQENGPAEFPTFEAALDFCRIHEESVLEGYFDNERDEVIDLARAAWRSYLATDSAKNEIANTYDWARELWERNREARDWSKALNTAKPCQLCRTLVPGAASEKRPAVCAACEAETRRSLALALEAQEVDEWRLALATAKPCQRCETLIPDCQAVEVCDACCVEIMEEDAWKDAVMCSNPCPVCKVWIPNATLAKNTHKACKVAPAHVVLFDELCSEIHRLKDSRGGLGTLKNYVEEFKAEGKLKEAQVHVLLVDIEYRIAQLTAADPQELARKEYTQLRAQAGVLGVKAPKFDATVKSLLKQRGYSTPSPEQYVRAAKAAIAFYSI